MATSPSNTLEIGRRLLLGLLTLGLAGTTLELLLMGHDEDWRQFIPFTVMGLSMAAILWFALAECWPGRVSKGAVWATRCFRLCMVLLMLSGATGVILHYRANMEFQLEMDPSLGGMALLLKALHAKAPPALAPGNMALFGLLGLVSTLGLNRTSRRI